MATFKDQAHQCAYSEGFRVGKDDYEAGKSRQYLGIGPLTRFNPFEQGHLWGYRFTKANIRQS